MKKLIFFLVIFALCGTNSKSFASTDTLNLGEVRFKTNQTWTIGDQEWSDVVIASGCEKEDYKGESEQGYLADCYQDSTHGIVFSWEAVNRYKTRLCPTPWRVPTKDEFIALDKALGGAGNNREEDDVVRDRYLKDWGGSYGYCLLSAEVIQCAYFWSQSEGSPVSAHRLHFNSKGKVFPRAGSYKEHAHSVRCVR